ncbi:CorA family divalent cation transporter [Streptomyces liliifuscus]|uniref:Magnesium transporter CorA n=1 Tax=Streptomyces liliifuscus TaxID=2797636 RepID=A0A7T7RGD6_9ACTN|nr:CorA family divalent cation transporter [Streptomyces liliifuscus]QQM45642.1 hypothetical protein JEQ17_43675 [Streptomyces liliifuscus]
MLTGGPDGIRPARRRAITAHDTPQQQVPVVECALYEHGRRRPGHLPLEEAMDAAHTTPGAFVWIDLHAPTADQLQVVAVDNALTMALARTSVRQNHDMRRISAAAALIAVPIAGVYGMNFDHMPELRWLFGYPAMLVTTATLVTSVYRVFRKKRWL